MKIQSIICVALILAILCSPAWAGCGRWVIRDNTDYLADPIFDEAVASSTGGNATDNSGGSPAAQNDTEEKITTSQAEETTAVQQEVPEIDLAGKWTLRMADGLEGQVTGKTMQLILIQTEDRLQGYGTILEEDADIPAMATGTISQDDITLDVKLTQQKRDYRLSLALVNSQLQGSYQLYDMQELSDSGNVTAIRSGS